MISVDQTSNLTPGYRFQSHHAKKAKQTELVAGLNQQQFPQLQVEVLVMKMEN